MSMDTNRQIVLRFFHELWNDRRLGIAAEIISSDCVTHQLRSGGDDPPATRGPDALAAHVAEWVRAFPDIRFEIEQMIADGDLVATRCTASGTHSAAWLGIPATGRRISIRMTVTHRVASDLIVEDWVLVDFLGVLQQLGVLAPTSELLRHPAAG